MSKLAKRIQAMQESATLATGARAQALKAQGKDIIDLTLGQPDFSTPKNIGKQAIDSIVSGQASYYTVASGLPDLKSAITSYMKHYYGYEVSSKEIVAATGAKFILYAFFMAVLDEGDEVLIPTPYWVSYAEQVVLAQGQPIFVETNETNQFKVTVADLEQMVSSRTKVLLLNTPSNPTGMVYSREELLAIGRWAVERDVLILADDIYGRLVYNETEFVPISSLSEAIRQQTVVVNGVSKTYAMTGWRVGFAVGNAAIISAMSKFISQTTSNLTTVAQYAAIEALTGPQDEVEKMCQAFEERLNTIYPLIQEIPGFSLIKPQGAFYLFINVSEAMKLKGYEQVVDFTNDLLEKTGVALVAGEGFGAPNHIRLSYATDLKSLTEAAKRIKSFMEN
ncbi:pyridoxal phosphate-dependent aminotransferase [Streptococcus sp. sy010]|uniref:pyridoxal phosphate-dependent aminotransferase n=1 Tax=Streptococcus sp. sy010 TaxID=2600148 RepID=UPI0011B71133|nr:pyridoxal phosphate-dependent aminotransferase [Streptococcus sp. sy010]TWT16506.1 pyridoxal phosphate-dependent aminotransferase [Streptococcus sp. sy010]